MLGRDYSDNWFYLGHANATFFITLPVVALLFIYSYHFNKGLDDDKGKQTAFLEIAIFPGAGAKNPFLFFCCPSAFLYIGSWKQGITLFLCNKNQTDRIQS